MNMSMAPLLERLMTPVQLEGDLAVRRAGGAPQVDVARLCRELMLLFNATGLGSTCALGGQPHVSRSVLNYGLGNLAGVVLSSIDTQRLERRIREIVLDFEPRIQRCSLDVHLLPEGQHSVSLNFLIEGDIRGPDLPQAFQLQSVWNTESGEVRVLPYTRNGRDG